jgi:hypothetical protein
VLRAYVLCCVVQSKRQRQFEAESEQRATSHSKRTATEQLSVAAGSRSPDASSVVGGGADLNLPPDCEEPSSTPPASTIPRMHCTRFYSYVFADEDTAPTTTTTTATATATTTTDSLAHATQPTSEFPAPRPTSSEQQQSAQVTNKLSPLCFESLFWVLQLYVASAVA